MSVQYIIIHPLKVCVYVNIKHLGVGRLFAQGQHGVSVGRAIIKKTHKTMGFHRSKRNVPKMCLRGSCVRCIPVFTMSNEENEVGVGTGVKLGSEVAPQTAGNGPRIVLNWNPESESRRVSMGLWRGRWISRLLGAPTTEPFSMEVGQAIAGLKYRDAENVRIYGYKQGWKMTRQVQPDGTYTVGRIAGVSAQNKEKRGTDRMVKCSDGRWRSVRKAEHFEADVRAGRVEEVPSPGGAQWVRVGNSPETEGGIL